MTLSCNSSGCPYAHITWKNVTHQSLRSWNDAQAFVSQIGPWTVGVEDNRTFICEVECGSVVKSKLTELKVFCKYDTNLAYNTYILVLILKERSHSLSFLSIVVMRRSRQIRGLL